MAIDALPEGLSPLFQLRPQRELAEDLKRSIPRPNLLLEGFKRDKRDVVTPLQPDTVRADLRAVDLGQKEPTPSSLKPLNKLNETDVAQIASARKNSVAESGNNVSEGIIQERVALRNRTVRGEPYELLPADEDRRVLTNQQSSFLILENSRTEKRLISHARELAVENSKNLEEGLQVAADLRRASPPPPSQAAKPPPREDRTEPAEARSSPSNEKQPALTRNPPPPSNTTAETSDKNQPPPPPPPNPGLDEKVRTAYGIPGGQPNVGFRAQDLFERLSKVSVQG